MTGYTIHMVHQMKTITDAAVDAGVSFMVHLGVFGNGRSTDPHFAWHKLVERYIEGSGVAWCC
jgi:NAD(P)H dehydrogenase (quinone)